MARRQLRDREADRRGARDDEGRRDEARAGDVLPGRRPGGGGAPRGVPARAGQAARRRADGLLQADATGDRGGPGSADLGGLLLVRRGADRGGLDRSGLPRDADRRPRGGREGAVPRRGGRGAGGSAEPRHDHAPAQADDAGARREGDRRGDQGADRRGARLRARGPEPALARAHLRRSSVHRRARTWSAGCRASGCSSASSCAASASRS